MSNQDSFKHLSGFIERLYFWFRAFKEPLLRPAVLWLASMKVPPNAMTALGLLMLFPFVYFFSFNPLLAALFLILTVFFDGLDGALARYTHQSSLRGAFLDISADFLTFVVVFLTFMYFGALSPFWGALYLVSYAVMEGFVYYAHGKGLTVFPTLSSKLLFYLVFLIWALSGVDFFDLFLVLMCVYMLVTDFFLFLRIYWSLSSH